MDGQIRSFQDYFDALMSGDLARRRMTKFMPADFKLIETPLNVTDSGLRTKQEHFLDRLLPLPSRTDIHDLELRLGERMELLAVRFDRAFDPRVS